MAQTRYGDLHETFHVSRLTAAEGLREERNALGAAFFLLLRSLVGLHFDLLHGVLEASPFFRSHRHKLKAELPPSAPPN